MSYKYSTGSVRRGDVYYEDDRTGAATYIDFGQDTITLRPSGSQILHTQADAVGIGTTSPDYTLDVAGDIGVDEYIYHNGDADTLIRLTDDKIVLKAGNLAMVTAEQKTSAPHEVTINDGSNNIDFVVKGNGSRGGNPGMKFDASTNKVGINGVGTPEESLHVDGNIKVFGNDVRIKIDGDTDSHPGVELYENGTRKWIVFNDYTNDNLTFKTNSNTRMSIEQAGDVGIGTTSPDEKLHIAGNLKVDGGAPEVTVRRDNNADASTIQFQGSGGVVGAYVKFLGDESGAGGTNNDLALGTGATVTERMRIRGDGKVGIGTTAPKTTLDVHHDPTSLANDTGGGEVVTFGAGPSGGSTTAGKLYYLDTDGQWEEADADALASSGVLLAIALGTSPSTHGMLLRGFFDVHSYFIGTFNEGVPVYVSTTAGSISVNAPSGGGDIVRIVGFCTTTANVIYFNPSNNTLELS